MIELVPILVPAVSFLAIAAAVFVLGQYILAQVQIQRRLPEQVAPGLALEPPLQGFDALVARHFNPARFGIGDAARERLRRKLLDAGYFRRQAINHYAFARVAAAVLVPAMALVASNLFLPQALGALRLPLMLAALLIGIAGPDFYLVRRQRALTLRHRQAFPDLLDLLVVCVDAGLSLEAAFDRVTSEVTKRSHALGVHLAIMSAEMHAGRGMVEA